jgi:rare lipoprotein A
VFGAPLLLLQQASARAPGAPIALDHTALHRALRDAALSNVTLPSQLVRYQSSEAKVATMPTAPTTTVPPTTTPTPAVPDAGAAPPPVPTVAPKAVSLAAAPAATSVGGGEHGQATWYAAAPPGRCASPTLPFGTVLTVTNLANGARTICTVDDREQAGYPRVVDLSPSGFAQLASTSQGVVDVSISW